MLSLVLCISVQLIATSIMPILLHLLWFSFVANVLQIISEIDIDFISSMIVTTIDIHDSLDTISAHMEILEFMFMCQL